MCVVGALPRRRSRPSLLPAPPPLAPPTSCFNLSLNKSIFFITAASSLASLGCRSSRATTQRPGPDATPVPVPAVDRAAQRSSVAGTCCHQRGGTEPSGTRPGLERDRRGRWSPSLGPVQRRPYWRRNGPRNVSRGTARTTRTTSTGAEATLDLYFKPTSLLATCLQSPLSPLDGGAAPV